MSSKNYRTKIKVFVTGAGCAVGQAIVKSLNISKLKIHISVGDIAKISLGPYTKNKFLIPKVEKKESLKWYLKFFKKYKFDILFIGSEYEIEFFSKHKSEIEKKTGILVCVSQFETVSLFNNKLSTISFLTKNNFNYPKTINIKNKLLNKKNIVMNYPLYLKNTKGTSSRNVFMVKNLSELKEKSKLFKNPIIQENLGKKHDLFKFNNEYTCSLFYGKNGELIGPFLSERILKHGTSWAIRSIKNKILENLIFKVGKNLSGIGSINFQIKKHKKKFYIFEINPRFSCTTYIRALLGFNEPELFVKNYFLNQKINKIHYKKGSSFRFFEDIVIIDNKKILNQNLNHLHWYKF